jgi:hypothetical protein
MTNIYNRAVKELPPMAASIYDKHSYPTIELLVKLCQANIDIAYDNCNEEEEKKSITALKRYINKYQKYINI